MSSNTDAQLTPSHMTFQIFTPRVPILNIGTNETSHFRLFLHERYYLFTVPTFLTELLKKTLLGPGFPTQNFYMQFKCHAPWHPAWETWGKDCSGTHLHRCDIQETAIFSVGYFQQFRCLIRIKEDGRISNAALDHQNCRDPINHNQNHLHLISHLCCSHAEEMKGRERRAALSPWRKCRHSGSALTLLTCRFLNMRSFWTADLNITVLWGRNRSNGACYSSHPAYKT